MKAIRVHEHGGADKLALDSLPAPVPASREVLVKISFTSVNRLDLWVREGLPGLTFPLPLILGSDGAGSVAEIGSEVTDLKIGDRVLISPATSCGTCAQCLEGRDNLCRQYRIRGEHCDGVDAEYVSAKREDVFKLPDNVALEDAAASALVFITAYQMLVDKARIQPMEDVLVLGAGSGVGSAAIQIARLHGARVIAVAGSEEKLDKAKALGANELINYKAAKISHSVRQLTDRGGVDVVFEHTGVATWQESILSAKYGGRIVTCGATTGFDAVTDLRQLFAKQLTIYGSTMASKSRVLKLIELLSAGKFRSVIDRTLPFTDVAEAHRVMERREHFGKILLTF